MLTRRVLSMLVAGVAVAGCATEADGPVTTELPAGEALLMTNPGCAEAARRLGRDLGTYEVRAPAEALGELSFDTLNRAVISSEDGRSIDWYADVGVDAVLVTGGRRTQVYVYDPEAREDSGLTAPRSKLGVAPPVAEVAICYDHELAFSSVSAKTALVRTQRWMMELAPERQDVTIPAGTVKAIPLRLAVTPSRAIDSGWTAHGALTLSNPSPERVEVVAIGDRFHELKVAVRCQKGGPPYVVPAFGSLVCPWSVQLPDGAARTLELEAVTRGEVGGAVASAAIDFAAGDVMMRDGKAWVWDEHAGFLGTVEGAQARVFDFDIEIGPYAWCPAEGIFADRAMLYGNDTGQRVEARTWLRVKVPCE